MLKAKANWNINATDIQAIERLIDVLHLNPLIAELLVARGITLPEQAENFLHGGAESFHDPLLLDGMHTAVERIHCAVMNKEKICIYGDYDADGVSSTVLMIFLLKQLGACYEYYIPHRQNEGYGLNRYALETIHKHRVSLVITVDTGISAIAETAYAAELGIDVIITDHHQPPENLPNALAIINPQKPGCLYPFKQLAGVGVAFKLAHALLGRLPIELLEIAAIGTIADLVPLTGENRLLVKLGLERMRMTQLFGIKALLNVSGIDKKTVTSSHIGFSLTPRINAGGRLDRADIAVRLLTADNEQEAEQLSIQLDGLNKERQRIVEETTNDALCIIANDNSIVNSKVIVLAKENWHSGVLGIVASKILDQFYRPTIILSIDAQTGLAKGSARSIAGFDIHKALFSTEDLLLHYGGHKAAAGMTIHRDQIPLLTHRLNQLADEWLSVADFKPVLQADLLCELKHMPLELIKKIDQLAPFGAGNPVPKFIVQGLQLAAMKTMGKDQQHLKLTLKELVSASLETSSSMEASSSAEASCSVEAVAFGFGSLTASISPTAKLDVFGELTVNEWNGQQKAQFKIHDLRIQEVQVFDWRGTQEFESKWLSVSKGKTGIVLFNESELSLLPPEMETGRCSIWLADAGGRVRLQSANDGETDFSQLTERIYYFLPESLSQLHSALSDAASLERVYVLFRDSTKKRNSTIPGRDMFKKVYAVIRQQSNVDDTKLTALLDRKSGLTVESLQFIVKVFEELGLITKTNQYYSSVDAAEKRNLTHSKLYQQRLGLQEVEQVLVYSSSQQLCDWIKGLNQNGEATNGL